MPKLLVFAGPNGSGKSTITTGIKIIGEYVNADTIKKSLKCTDLEAAQIATETRENLLKNGSDFTFETVLSTTGKLDLIARAKSSGYYIVCVYVLTVSPKINISRVAKRVLLGGHPVPKEKIESRYICALTILPYLFGICDEIYIFDNSPDVSQAKPSMIVESKGQVINIYPNDIWSKDMIKELMYGNYAEKFL